MPSLLFGTLGIGMTFLIGRRLFRSSTALIAAWLHAGNGFLIDLEAGRRAGDHVDALFIFLVELGVLFAVIIAGRWKSAALCGIVTGLAVLTKWASALIILPLWILNRGSGRSIFPTLSAATLLILLTLAISFPWQRSIEIRFPDETAWEQEYNLRHLSEVLEGHGGGPLTHVIRMGRYYGELVYVAILYLFVSIIRDRRSKPLQLLTFWITIPYLIFSIAATKMPGYVMMSAPAVFLAVARIITSLQSLKTRRWRRLAPVLVAAMLLLPLRYGIERVKPMAGPEEQSREWAKRYRLIDERTGGGPIVLFGMDRPIEAMFYSSAVAYSRDPRPELVSDLRRRGYRVLVTESDGESFSEP